MEFKIGLLTASVTFSYSIYLTLCVQNFQREEPDFQRVVEHPKVDETSDVDPEPFVPHIVPKPIVPAVPNLANCSCGEHDYNTTSIEKLKCGDRPWHTSRVMKPMYLVSNGNITDKSQFPWVVALVDRRANGSAIHFCGGTLISSKLVLTATHCFKGRPINRTEVWVNERNFLLSTEDKHHTVKIRAQRLIVHPKYNPIMHYNDIVLLELSESVPIQETFLRPICLPRDESYDMKEFAYTAGWGRTSYKGPKSNQLQHTCLPLLTHEECVTKSVAFYKDRVTPWMICAGDIKNGGPDACPGDSGGPLFVESGEPKRYYLVGIVSWGEQCALAKRPGVYTRVSKYLPWIYNESSWVADNKMCG